MNQGLQVFVKVVEEQNFSKAAAQLHMTQPAVSQSIRSLENEMNIKLLDRTNKYVRLNKAGEIVYHHAKEIIELYEKMQRLVQDLSSEAAGKLSIGASYTFGEYILPGIIAQLKDSFPNIKASVTIANTAVIAELVAGHQLDIGIVEGQFKEKFGLQSEMLAEDRMVIFASSANPLALNNKPVSIDQLAAQCWILREDGSGTREAVENVFQRLGFYPADIMEFSSTQSIKSMVEAGAGISLLSEWAIQKELQRDEFKVLDVKGIPHIREFAIVTNSPFQTKALSVFVELVKQSQQQDIKAREK